MPAHIALVGGLKPPEKNKSGEMGENGFLEIIYN
jgi:hypothetical protein